MVRGITAAILAATFSYAFVNSITGVMVNDVVAAFSLTGTAQGLLSSMLNVGLVLALLVNPLLQGRTGKLTMLLVSMLLQIVMLLLSGGVYTFGVFVCATVGLGVGCGWVDAYVNSCMIDLHPADGPKYLGLLHGIFGIGSLLAPLLIQWIALRSHWRTALFAMAALVLAAMVFVAVMSRGAGRAGILGRTQEERLSLKQAGAYLRSGRNLLLLGCGAMCAIVQTGLVCWIARYMLLVHNSETLGATCLTIFWITATANRFIAPRLRVRPLVLILGGGLLSALSLIAGVLSGSAVVMCVCVGLTGFTSGHFIPMLVSECAEGYHGSTTLTTSVLMFVMGVTRVVVPLAMAALTDALSAGTGMLIPGFAGVLAAMFASAARRLPAPSAARS